MNRSHNQVFQYRDYKIVEREVADPESVKLHNDDDNSDDNDD